MNRILTEISKYQKKPAARKADGVFTVEGEKMFSEAPAKRIRSVVVSESYRKAHPMIEEEVRENALKAGRKTGFYTVSDADFQRVSETETPQGVLAVAEQFSYTEEDLFRAENGLFILLESVQDPGNVGTIFRSAEAAGASGVILSGDTADAYNPKVVRATMGSIFRVPFLRVQDPAAVIAGFQARGGKVYAAHLRGSIPYDEADYRALSMILVGNESNGLTEETARLADGRVRIPMLGKTESLNVAMASTVLLYEALRQRK